MAELNGESSSHRPSTKVMASGDGTTSDASVNRRPRDGRTIHLMLASMGISSYQERVPLALMDIAYRYTTSVIQDALLYWDSAHPATTTAQPPAQVTLSDLRMAIASKVNHQFITAPPKEFMLDVAQERNKIALPPVKRDWGVRLPPEQFCLTGVNWDLLAGPEVDDGADEEEEEEEEDDDEMDAPGELDKPQGDMMRGDGRDRGDEEMPDAINDMFGGGGGEDRDQDMSGA